MVKKGRATRESDKRDRRVKALPQSAQDPEGLWRWAERYMTAQRVQNYSETTIKSRRSNLRTFVEWCEVRGVLRPMEVTKPILEAFQRHLFYTRRPDGKPLGFRAQSQQLVTLRSYFRWLSRQNVILSNPAADLDMPRRGVHLPKEVLNEREVEVVMAQPDTSDRYGIRDRAILEVLYSTGIRRQELSELGLYDIDSDRRTLLVRAGKGNKDRVVPIGERALAWVDKYVREVRADLVTLPDPGALFLTRFGDPISLGNLSLKVRGYIAAAELGKTGSCHLMRHTMATVMLERGADVRYIQEILGHTDISSTQIYTHVSIKRLQEVHAATHPTARLSRPIAKPESPPAPASTEEELLAQLAQEAVEEQAS